MDDSTQLADANRENDALRRTIELLRADVRRMDEAVTHAVKGMTNMAEKLATAGMFLGFSADEPKEHIGEKCRLLNAELARLRKECE